VPEGNYSKILAFGLLVGWAIRGAGDWRFGKGWVIILSLIGYIVWTVACAPGAMKGDVAWDMVDGQAKIVLLVVVGMTMIDSVEKLRHLAWVILVSYGYVAYELNVNYFNGFNQLQEMGFGSLDNNSMAITLVTCTGLGIFLCFSARKLWQQAIAVACIGFLVHAIMFSFSRGGMLGLLLVVGLSFYLIPKRPVHFAALIVGILVTLGTTGQEVTERFNSSFAEEGERDSSAQSRVEMWKICVRVAGENPLFGLGPDHFHVHAHEFGLAVGKEAHSTWLQLAVEIGIPGVSFLFAFFALTVVRLWPVTRSSFPVPDPFLKDIARMVIASTAGYVFTAQFVTLPGVESPYYIVLLGAGALKILSNPDLCPNGKPVTDAVTNL